jgi:hypothetical protein
MSGSGVGRAPGRGASMGWAALLLAAGAWSCATQQGTAQALTVGGAAAVMVGASLASSSQCASTASVGGPAVYCPPRSSSGARSAGTALAAAGVGLAAAGYALRPKGPDRVRAAVAAAPGSSWRLVRATPAQGSAEGATDGSEGTPAEERCAPAEEGSPGASAGAGQQSGCPDPSVDEPAAASAAPELALPGPPSEPKTSQPGAAQPEAGEPAPQRPDPELP